MNNKKANWLWPDVTSIEGAEKAITTAFWAAMFSTFITVLISVLSLFGKGVLNITISGLADAALFFMLGFGVKQRSRASAAALLIVFVIEKVIMALENPANTTNLISGMFWTLFYVHGVRGTFAYHRLNHTRVNAKNVVLKTVLALVYGFVTLIVSSVILVLFQPNPSDDAYALILIPPAFVIWLSYLGKLPFTKKPVRIL